jgi:photosystem II stability/assembly factor-like uncharacterized protein
MLAGAFRFAGGTLTDQRIGPTDALTNSAQFIAFSPASAVESVAENQAYWTDDSGHTWHRSRLPSHNRSAFLAGASILNARSAFAIDGLPRSATILRTTNAGRSWSALPGREGVNVRQGRGQVSDVAA